MHIRQKQIANILKYVVKKRAVNKATTNQTTTTNTMATDTRRRVKLYALNAERQWDDRGTGHVSSNYVDRLKGISLLVRAEADGSLLLESKIQPDTAYQKQQDTLIVWSEGDNFDLALSFQEKAGCDEIWEKICIVSEFLIIFRFIIAVICLKINKPKYSSQ